MGREDSVRHMSNNEANRVTREAICTALLELMDQKEFESITISDLAKRAGVSRQSFYRNYTSKEDIIIEIEETILNSFRDSLDDPKYRNDLRLWLTDYFSFVRENHKLVAILDKAHLSDVLFSKAPFIVEDWMGESGSGLHYYVVGSLGAMRTIVMDWFYSGMKESSEYMADICMCYDLGRIMKK